MAASLWVLGVMTADGATVKKADDTSVTGPLVALERGAVILNVTDNAGRQQREAVSLEDVVEMTIDAATDATNAPAEPGASTTRATTKPSSSDAAVPPPPVVTPQGFMSLFDGATLKGWDGAGDVWSVREGAILGEITEKSVSNRVAFLTLAGGEHGDFELHYRFRITGGLRNSAGVQFRSRATDVDGGREVQGYQQDLGIPAGLVGGVVDTGANAAGAPVKALPGERVVYDAEGRRTVTPLARSADELSAAFKENDWNDAVIAVKGNHVASLVNGELFAEVINETPAGAKSGVIALQLSRRRVMSVQFRDLRLRRLGVAGTPSIAGLELGGNKEKPTNVVATGATGPDVLATPTVWQVRLSGGDHVSGRVSAWDDARLTMTHAHGELAVPATALREVWRAGADEVAKARAAAKSANAAPTDDVAFARKDAVVVPVAGRVLGLVDGGRAMKFRFRDEDRTIAVDKLVGVTLAAAADDDAVPPATATANAADGAAQATQSLELISGDVISGRWTALEGGAVTLATPWGGEFRVAVKDVARLRTRNGRLVYLSDLKPAQLEQVPYFDRLMPFRADRSLTGGPIKMTSGEHAKGLSVHARTVLHYDVGGRFERLRTKVGFQQPEGKAGRAVVRVRGDDGRVLHEIPDARGDQPPVDLDLPIGGVRRLTLEVDFGADQDVGDRVVWADARLIRSPAAAAPHAATPRVNVQRAPREE